MRTFSAALIALLGSFVLLGTQAKAAVPFIEIPADGWDPGPEVRKQYEVGIYDWARRVKVNPVALASSQIQVDLFDAVLTLEQTEPGPRKPEMDALYFPSEDGQGYHRTYSASQTLWVGEVVGAGRVSNDPVHPVRISNIGEGRLMASFNRGHLRYELRGNLLVRSDQRRLPPEAPSVRDPYPLDQRVLDTLASPDTPSTVRVAFGYGNNATAAGGVPEFFQAHGECCNDGQRRVRSQRHPG